MTTDTLQEYRSAVADMQRLEHAREGTPEFNGRREAITVMHDYELDYLVDPELRRELPAGSI